VAPAILATTAMNAAFNQTSFDVFTRIKTERAYEAVIPTPLSVADIALGEVVSGALGGLLSSVGFVVAMLVLGLVVSPGVVIAVPASLLVGFAFGAAGLAVTTYLLRDFSDFQLIQLVLLPMFLFATTFYPLSVYPDWLRPVIQALPLYQSIQLMREPALGQIHWDFLVAVVYLAVFGTLALSIAARRLARMLLA
jgi:lipooligosaccharide transport system permease protein